MKNRLSLVEVVGQTNAWTHLYSSINQIEIVVAKAKIDRQVVHRRKVILDIGACLAAFKPTAECRKHVGITATIKEKAFQFTQADQVHTGLDELSVPVMRKIALDT